MFNNNIKKLMNIKKEITTMMIIASTFSILFLVTVSINLIYAIDSVPKPIQDLLEDVELPKNLTNEQLEQFEDFKSFVDKKIKDDEAKKDLEDTWNKARYAILSVARAGELNLGMSDAKKIESFAEQVLNVETNDEAKNLIHEQIPQIENMLIPEDKPLDEKNAKYMICYYNILHDIFLPDADFGQLSLGDKKMMALWDRIMADKEIDKDERYRIQQTFCN